MSQQERIARPAKASEEQPQERLPGKQEGRDEHLAAIDDLLDEIDEVLEKNAEEFVKSYVQKGGQ
jgi:ubiquitin-like protein Pup